MTDQRKQILGANRDIIAIAQSIRDGHPVPPGYVYRSDVAAVASPDGRIVILDDETHPQTPIFVDIKITDVCDAGCPYCYMSSTTKGKHASRSTIYKFIDSFGEYPPLLVTFGGGEPTKHPHFVDIIREMSERGILVTTSVGRAVNIAVLEKALPYLKRVGVSVSPGPLEPILRALRVCKGKAVLHVPLFPKVVSNAINLLNIFLTTGDNPIVSILALTPHNVGRGSDYVHVSHKEIANAIKTLVVYAKELGIEFAGNPCWTNNNAAVVPEVDMRCSGGQWSMAFDAVESKMSRCSYLFDEQEKGTDVRAWWKRQTLKTGCHLELPFIPELHTTSGAPILPDHVHQLLLPPELLIRHLSGPVRQNRQ